MINIAIRVLSGILDTRGHNEGSVRIDFNPHGITGTLDRIGQKHEIGPSHRFTEKPCKITALRQIDVAISHPGGPHIRDIPEHERFKINSIDINRDYWEITWSGHIEEISYMVVGNVPD